MLKFDGEMEKVMEIKQKIYKAYFINKLMCTIAER